MIPTVTTPRALSASACAGLNAERRERYRLRQRAPRRRHQRLHLSPVPHPAAGDPGRPLRISLERCRGCERAEAERGAGAVGWVERPATPPDITGEKHTCDSGGLLRE